MVMTQFHHINFYHETHNNGCNFGQLSGYSELILFGIAYNRYLCCVLFRRIGTMPCYSIDASPLTKNDHLNTKTID